MIYSEVHSFRIYTSLVKICFKNKSCFDIGTISCDKKNEYNLSDYLQFFSNPLYLRTNQGSCYLIAKGFLRLFNFYSEVIDNVGICYEDGLKKYKDKNLFHLPEERQILKEWLPNSIFNVEGKYWVNDTLKDFKLIDAEKGEIVWAIPQPTVEKPYGYQGLTNIKKVLGIYKSNLWVQLPDSRVLALDLETGITNHEVKHFYFSSFPDGIFLDNRGAIIIFHYNVYAEFSINTMDFVSDKIISSEKELIIRQVLHRNNDKYLYFTGNKDGSFEPNAYGIFDTNTQSIKFIKEREVDMGYFYDTPQVNDEIFAILDDKGNLILHKIKEILS